MSSVTDHVDVVIGVDTHTLTHTAAAVSTATGALLSQVTVPTSPTGLASLIAMAQDYPCRAWAIEGTGSYGANLTRVLGQGGELIIEIDRPTRIARRNGAKSDDLDAARAAREAIARPHSGSPRGHGRRAALAAVLSARESAVQAAGDTARQVRGLLISAPPVLRERLTPGQCLRDLTRDLARIRLNPAWEAETLITAATVRTLSRRVQALYAEAQEHEKTITTLVKDWRPDLLELPGIGPIVAATVLCAWSHPGRFRDEAAFAMLAGVAPIPASSGQTTGRHRLNRGGDRRLNRALHIITLTRMAHHEPSKAYTHRRRTQGKNNREIRRCLKRYIARDLFRLLENRTP